MEAADASGAVVSGAFGAWYPPLVDDGAQDLTAFLPISAAGLLSKASRSAGVRVDEIPGGAVAVFAHHGSYDDLGENYHQLGAWVATHADALELPVRELYLVGPDATDDDTQWRTEMCWPIQ